MRNNMKFALFILGSAVALGQAARVQSVAALTAQPAWISADGVIAKFLHRITAGGGSSLRAAGFPGVMPPGTTTGYADIGAIQHADPAGGAVASGAPIQ